MSSRWRGIGLVVILLLGVLVAWEPSRVAVQTAVLLPNLLDAGPKPLGIFSPAPRRASVAYWPVDGSQGEEELAELWLPAWASADRRAGAMLLVFGVNNLGRNHPAIVRVAEGLARTGVAVLVPDSRTMLDGRLGGDEVDKIVAAFSLLTSRPEVDAERAGMVGFSVGGSLALIAAADPAIDDQVAWVNAFGAYADAATYLASVASHAYIGTDGAAVPWQPTPLAREVFVNFMLDQVDTADRRRLRDAFQEPLLAGERVEPLPDLRERLGPGGQAVHDLLSAASWEQARRAVDRLPDATREFIAAISPVNHGDGLRADAYLMHERDDHHVPFVESDRLAELLVSEDRLHRYTRFRLFDHVQPDDLDLIAAAPELWKLLWHVHTLMVETL